MPLNYVPFFGLQNEGVLKHTVQNIELLVLSIFGQILIVYSTLRLYVVYLILVNLRALLIGQVM